MNKYEFAKQNRIPNYLLNDSEWKMMSSVFDEVYDSDIVFNCGLGWVKRPTEYRKRGQTNSYRLKKDYKPIKTDCITLPVTPTQDGFYLVEDMHLRLYKVESHKDYLFTSYETKKVQTTSGISTQQVPVSVTMLRRK